MAAWTSLSLGLLQLKNTSGTRSSFLSANERWRAGFGTGGRELRTLIERLGRLGEGRAGAAWARFMGNAWRGVLQTDSMPGLSIEAVQGAGRRRASGARSLTK